MTLRFIKRGPLDQRAPASSADRDTLHSAGSRVNDEAAVQHCALSPPLPPIQQLRNHPLYLERNKKKSNHFPPTSCLSPRVFFFCFFYQSRTPLHLFDVLCRKLISLALKGYIRSQCKWGIRDERLEGNYLRRGVSCPTAGALNTKSASVVKVFQFSNLTVLTHHHPLVLLKSQL